jgi:tetratricopeptide (TPR) repeat protein
MPKRSYPTSPRKIFTVFFYCPLLIFLSITLHGCDSSFFKSAESLKTEATSALASKNFSIASDLAKRYIEKSPKTYEGYFILAQAMAQLGDRNEAISALDHAIQNGLKDDVQIGQCAQLEPIRSMPAYRSLLDTHFPGHSINASTPNEQPASIQEANGKQIIRAGDVVIETSAPQ